MSAILDLTKKLIECASITPNDAGCQDIIIQHLETLGFTIEKMPFGNVNNLWARYGKTSPLFVFAGHTDVVPPGPEAAWLSPAFQASIRGEYLYGRGATDMKSGLAAMLISASHFIQKNPDFPGSIAFLITSDEEGRSIDGTQKVVEVLQKRGEKLDYCLIAEASSEKILGDQIRIGRRGSLHGKLIIHGKQGHIAYPALANNPIHQALAALEALSLKTWDQGNVDFPPTSFQISNIHAGTGALNVIPQDLEVRFNFRYSTACTEKDLMQGVTDILNKHPLKYDLEWENSAKPFLSPKGKLISVTQEAILAITGLNTQLSTGGGTSDGRFIAILGTELIELGPINKTAHQVNEEIRIADLEKLPAIYERILEGIFL